MSQFIEAVLVFGVAGLLCLGGCGAGAFVLIVRFFNKEAERELEELKKSAEVVLPPPYLNNNENYYARKERMNSITGGAEFFALVPVMTACALDLATHNRNFSLTRATLRTYGRTAAYLTRASIKAAPELIKFSRKTIETVAKILASCTRKK